MDQFIRTMEDTVGQASLFHSTNKHDGETYQRTTGVAVVTEMRFKTMR